MNILKYFFLLLMLTLDSFSGGKAVGQMSSEALHQKFVDEFWLIGFIKGQEIYCQKAIQDLPQLKTEINSALGHFNTYFGNVNTNIENHITEFFGEEMTRKIITQTVDSMYKISNQFEYDIESANELIKIIHQRAKGEIQEPYLGIMLHYQYLNKPENEITNGFFTTYSTLNHPKAKGTDWQMKIPKSWKAVEAERPNIIQKFISENGNGYCYALMMTKNFDLGLEENYTKEEIDIILKEYLKTDDFSKIIIEEGSEIFTKKECKIDGIDAVMADIGIQRQKLDQNMYTRALIFAFIHKNMLYMILFKNDGDAASKTSVDEYATKYKNLYLKMANSIVVSSQYK